MPKYNLCDLDVDVDDVICQLEPKKDMFSFVKCCGTC